MKQKVLLFAFIIVSSILYGQKAQRIGYIDMEYILENIPEYKEAQSQVNAKAASWQQTIDKEIAGIEAMRLELANEKALLTKDMIADKEEDIQIRELELKKLQERYFGAEGELFLLRRQLVNPIQDLVYNAVQDIATKRKYDFVLDNSSDLIMLFTNDQYDISEMVLSSITRAKKVNAAMADRSVDTEVDETASNEDAVDPQVTERQNARAAKKAEMQQKLEEKRAAQLKKREELKKAIEEKRLQRIKDAEAAKKAKENKKKNN